MARTPLLRAIRRLAADHGVADQLGIEPAEVRAERRAARQRDGSLRRREFLKLMAATGAATVLGGIRSAEGGGMAAPARIAIVGAGISGLTAALTLRDAGVDATVYEASGRVGGRISSLTNYWNEGQVSEWCGEQIDTNHEIVLGLASRFGLLVDDLIEAEPEGASETYFFQGGYYTEREADRDFGRVSKRLEADLEAAGDTTTYDTHTPAGIALDNMSVAEWIDLRVPNGRGSRFGKLLDIAYEIEGGAPTGDQSALNLIYLLGDQPDSGPLSLFGTSDGRYHIAGGNQRLPEAIAAALGPGTGIRTGYRLVRIEQTRGTVKLTFLTRGRLEMVEADLALLTIPFAVLRTSTTRTRGSIGSSTRRSRNWALASTGSWRSSSTRGSGPSAGRGASARGQATRRRDIRAPGKPPAGSPAPAASCPTSLAVGSQLRHSTANRPTARRPTHRSAPTPGDFWISWSRSSPASASTGTARQPSRCPHSIRISISRTGTIESAIPHDRRLRRAATGQHLLRR